MKDMKISIKILFLCCFLALALIPLQATALSACDITRTVGTDGITLQFASSPIFPPGAITSGCHEGCLCSVVEFELVEFEYIEENHHPLNWNTRAAHLPLPYAYRNPSPLSEQLRSFNYQRTHFFL